MRLASKLLQLSFELAKLGTPQDDRILPALMPLLTSAPSQSQHSFRDQGQRDGNLPERPACILDPIPSPRPEGTPTRNTRDSASVTRTDVAAPVKLEPKLGDMRRVLSLAVRRVVMTLPRLPRTRT